MAKDAGEIPVSLVPCFYGDMARSQNYKILKTLTSPSSN